MNVMQNAVHASEAKGGVVTVRVDAHGERARLVVKDDGAGMDAETRGRMFDRFFTTKPDGTGLGMSIVHRIVAAARGTIGVKSAPGRGTEIEVLLPAIDEARPAAAATAPSSPPRPRPRERDVVHVLFVDDEPRISELTSHVLVHHGFRVTAHTNPTLALDAFRADPDGFDVVVTDHTMPTMSGLDLARQIVAIRPGTPVLLASGHAEPLQRDVLERHGVVGALPKPFPISTLAEKIRASLAR